DIEHVKELGAKLEDAEFTVSPVPEGGIFDQGNVVLMKTGSAKSVAAQGAEAAGIRAGASGEVDGNEEERIVLVRIIVGFIWAAPKIVLTHGAAGGKIGRGHKIGAIRSTGASTGLLYSRVDREGRPAGQRSNIEELPPARDIFPQRFQERHPIKWQQLDQAHRKTVGHIKVGWPSVCPGIPRVLRQVLRRRTSVIDRFGKGITGLKAQADS